MKNLMWPRQIPPQLRNPVGSGPKCFAIWRAADAPLFQRRRTRLTGNMFVLVLQGNVVFERDGQRVVVDQGGACLASPGYFRVSEIPDRVGRFQSHLTFFNRPVVKQVLQDHEHLAQFAATQPRHEVFKAVYPLHNPDTERLCRIVRSGGTFPTGLSDVLGSFMSTSASAFMFLQAALPDLPTQGRANGADAFGCDESSTGR